ncbi:MAG: hypothetical protein ACRDFX_06035 [Chloroflexota bacterium]
MIFEIGHVALVVPDLARDFVTAPDVGTYVYAGALTWTHSPRALYVGRLAN